MRDSKIQSLALGIGRGADAFPFPFPFRQKCEMTSMGTGKMMVEFFSAEMVFSVCK